MARNFRVCGTESLTSVSGNGRSLIGEENSGLIVLENTINDWLIIVVEKKKRKRKKRKGVTRCKRYRNGGRGLIALINELQQQIIDYAILAKKKRMNTDPDIVDKLKSRPAYLEEQNNLDRLKY